MGDYRDYNYDTNLYVKLKNFLYCMISIKVYKKKKKQLRKETS